MQAIAPPVTGTQGRFDRSPEVIPQWVMGQIWEHVEVALPSQQKGLFVKNQREVGRGTSSGKVGEGR